MIKTETKALAIALIAGGIGVWLSMAQLTPVWVVYALLFVAGLFLSVGLGELSAGDKATAHMRNR